MPEGEIRAADEDVDPAAGGGDGRGIRTEKAAERLPAAPARAIPVSLPEAIVGTPDEGVEVVGTARHGGGRRWLGQGGERKQRCRQQNDACKQRSQLSVQPEVAPLAINPGILPETTRTIAAVC
jgi:hypothetical protein